MIEFLNCIEARDRGSAKTALLKTMGFRRLSLEETRQLFEFLISEINRRNHTFLTPQQALRLTLYHLRLDSVASEYLRYFVPFLRATSPELKDNLQSISENGGPEIATGIIVGAVECFAGVLCCVIPNKLAWIGGGWLLEDGLVRMYDAIPQQNELNRQWRPQRGLEN